MGISENWGGPPKSSILIGFSLISPSIFGEFSHPKFWRATHIRYQSLSHFNLQNESKRTIFFHDDPPIPMSELIGIWYVLLMIWPDSFPKIATASIWWPNPVWLFFSCETIVPLGPRHSKQRFWLRFCCLLWVSHKSRGIAVLLCFLQL